MILNGRREFLKMAIAGSSVTGLVRAAGTSTLLTCDGNHAGPETYLKPFSYEGVQLLEGMLKKQYEAARDYYYAIPDDDIVRGFRQRAGLRAP